MRRLLLPLAALGLLAAGTAPATAQDASADKTRVYVVVVDGLRPDEVAAMPFLSSLAAGGTYYPESRGIMVAETIPNHVAMVTGNYADRNGIVANDFPDTTDDTTKGNEPVRFLESDSLFTLVQEQCPQLVTAAVTSKDYLYAVMDHDRTGDGKVDADSNFDNTSDPTFIPGAGLTPDERTIVEALRVSRTADPDFLFVNLGSVDRVGHADESGGLTTPLPTGSVPAARIAQRTLTDTYLRTFVASLQQDGRWDSTRLIVTADHSMDWSFPTSTVSLSPALEADPLTRGRFVIAQNGGAALYTLKDRAAADAPRVLARARALAVATEGVDEALYRQPNAVDGGERHWVGRVHPDWFQTHPRSGDLLVTVEDGLRVTEPSSFSNPLPGNHGMPSTLRIPLLVAGGSGVRQQTVAGASSDPFARDPRQAENVDVAPTAAWLLGVDPPAADRDAATRDGFDGRALREAFTTRPADACVRAGAAPVAVPSPSGRPASPSTPPPAAAPRPDGGTLPATGPEVVLPVVAALLAGLGIVLRRRARI